MNYYEIFKNGLKIIIKTNVTSLDKKMYKFFNGCFIINNFNKESISKELVVIDLVDRKSIDHYKDDYFIMNPNTWILSNKKNNIKFIYDDFNEIQCLNLKRIIIDIFAKYYECLGIYFVHGASVVNKETNKATIFIGDSNSGKTTNLLFYLLSGKYDYMGNDRIGLRYYDGKIITYGFPSNLGLRYPTLELSSELKNILLPYVDKKSYLNIINNCLYSKKLSLNVFDLLSIFSCKFVSEAELSKIIVTCYDETIHTDVFDEMSYIEVLKQIKRQHIPSVSKEQYFLNELLEFGDFQNEFDLFNAKVLAYKSNLHPNCNRKMIKK